MPDRFIANIETEDILVYIVSDEYIINCSNKEPRILPDFSHNVFNKAKFATITLSKSKCIFDNSLINSTTTNITNGKWLWSWDLNHYSKYHNFIWPETFMNSLEKDRYKVRSIKRHMIDEIGLISFQIMTELLPQQGNIISGNGQPIIFKHYNFKVIAL